MSFYSFFFVTNRIGSETSHKLQNWIPPQKKALLARDLFILMDSAIIWIYFRNSQPPISLTAAASLFRDTLAIALTNLLKQNLTFSSNIFWRPFNVDFAAAKASLVIISSSTSSSGSSGDGGDGSGSDSTSSCGSSSKILT